MYAAGGLRKMEINELGDLFKDIAEKTGTKVSLVAAEGCTRFSLDVGGVKTNAYIEGTGAEALARAKLVAYLVSGTGAKLSLSREEELKEILLGDGGRMRAYRFMTKYGLGGGVCYAIALRPDRHAGECFTHVERCLSDPRDAVLRVEGNIAVVKFAGDEQNAYEFGQFLSQSLFEELGVRASVGVGCEAKSFADVGTSYMQAATALRMGSLFHGEGEVHSYREFLLVRMLEDVGRAQLEEYMAQFGIEGAEEVFGDEEMTATAEAFLDSSLNISETSRNLFMHRNTLTYRLDKIERATGLNIRKFSDAVTFRVITVLYKLLKT